MALELGTGDLDAALDAVGHDRDAPSLFVCDGLLDSLTLEESASLCETLRARAPEASGLVADFFVAPEPGPLRPGAAHDDEHAPRGEAQRVPSR